MVVLILNSEYAANTDDWRSVFGASVFVEGAHVVFFRSATQSFVKLMSVTEAETGGAVVTTAQDMVYIYGLFISLGLKVKLSMVLVLEMDNKGAVDLANNWGVECGRANSPHGCAAALSQGAEGQGTSRHQHQALAWG
jgi:hypothetical protein